MVDSYRSNALDAFYEEIRKENVLDYGRLVGEWVPEHLENLYPDKTHFIYEMLQNAEDACERAKKHGATRRFRIRFELHFDRLEVRHNGILFDENDVKRISRIAMKKGKKDEDAVQIGKFGIGFKSVYEYTTSPEIYSGPYSFHIMELVKPYPKPHRKDVQTGETLFVIPLNAKKRRRELAHSEIEKRLADLGIRTLLFLKNIQEIIYETESKNGKYIRRFKVENGAKLVSLQHLERGEEKDAENWLVFEKSCDKDKNRVLEIAYLVKSDPKKAIIPARDAKLFAYFPTEKETDLKFLIQGPYNTTMPRDNIKDDEWNRELIEETASLVSESISKIKTLNLLDVGFLNTMPIETEDFTFVDHEFEPIYKKVKEKLSSDEALLPTLDRGFVTAEQAFLGRGEDIRSLLGSEQLDLIFETNDSRWLDKNITENRTPELWEYLTEVLGIKVVDPDGFAGRFNEDFISKQSDQWVISFYVFLLRHNALCRKGTSFGGTYYDRPGVLLSKPIIRLDDDFHIRPFDGFSKKPNAYLPHKDPNMRKIVTHVVKDVIASDEKARRFLENLGIREPDETVAIINTVLPKYRETATVPKKDNIQHLVWILKILESEPRRKDTLLEELRETPFLYAVNASNRQKAYRKPRRIYLGEKYTGTRDLAVYFEGNEEAWFLDKRYSALECDDEDDLQEKLKQIGCLSTILVHTRHGLDQFDPECRIEGLEHALQNITFEKSKILWNVAKACRKNICSETEFHAAKSHDDSIKNPQYSEMGKLLTENLWLPKSKDSEFYRPSQLMLKELPDGFDETSLEARDISERLGFRPEFDQETQEMLERAPEDAREGLRKVVEMYTSLPPEKRRRFLEIGRELKSSEGEPKGIGPLEGDGETTILVSPTSDELGEEFKKALRRERPLPPLSEDKTWKGPTPEQEERLRELAEEMVKELLRDPQMIKKGRKLTRYSKIGGKEEPVLKKFLLEQYAGYCQVCNTKLDLGHGKDPWFMIYRVLEKRRGFGAWSNQEFSILGVCPNCHALMKHGSIDLGELWAMARRVSKGEAAPEEVSERGGDFYIIPITIVGKEKELFIAPVHMAMIAAFLKMIEDRCEDSVRALTPDESRKMFPYECRKCGHLHSREDFRKDRFCKKCGAWIRRR